jgi:signal transduction histidine kinase
VQRVAHTVAQMRDLSRPASEKKGPTEVNALVEQVLELSRKRCDENQVEVVWKPAAHTPPLLLMADQIKQVFLNLLLNAIEAMPGGGQLRVSTACTSHPAGVRIEFTDNGVGIAPDVLPQVFEPFYSTKLEGIGLGLSISYTIVERHGGHIEVESRVGEGSTFTVWLPA